MFSNTQLGYTPVGVFDMQPSPDAASPRRRAAPTVDLGPQVNTAIWTLTILAGLFLGLRMFCKIWRVRKLWWDDYTLVASYVGISLGAGSSGSSRSAGHPGAKYLHDEQGLRLTE